MSPALAYLIGGAFTGVITALIASHKQRNAASWGVLGFLFGLIALIVCAVLPRRPAPGWTSR